MRIGPKRWLAPAVFPVTHAIALVIMMNSSAILSAAPTTQCTGSAPQCAVVPGAPTEQAQGLVRAEVPDSKKTQIEFGRHVPMRDGVELNATLYTLLAQSPAACILVLSPYTTDSLHARGVYFAAHGFPFLAVDVRGRGNSQGDFRPFLADARDGYDSVEWLAKQPYCNGKVGMWGGSYAGFTQWASVKERPPHLATIVPVAAPYLGVDVPGRDNIFPTYLVRYLAYIDGRTMQANAFEDRALWEGIYRRWVDSGEPFATLDRFAGNPSSIFQEWLGHPFPDAYWDSLNPTAAQYAGVSIPVLTITGAYDVDQLGALNHYREHFRNASHAERAKLFLVIGPWDHAGTRTPKADVHGVPLGPMSLLDLQSLHMQWYGWTMNDGPRPDFLKKPVAYYETGAERWRYADSLEAITAETQAYFLNSETTSVSHSGSISPAVVRHSAADHYIYDPRDLSEIEAENPIDPDRLDKRMHWAAHGQTLIYDSAPFGRPTEISGFFKLSAWLSIDQPDTDFAVSIYDVAIDGGTLLLSTDAMRARYRDGLRKPKLVEAKKPMRYDFEHFTFVSREIGQGHCLRLVFGPLNSMYAERNFNSGGDVARESVKEARAVTVTLYHDRSHPSALYVPLGQSATLDSAEY